jgi:hypothetical protein
MYMLVYLLITPCSQLLAPLHYDEPRCEPALNLQPLSGDMHQAGSTCACHGLNHQPIMHRPTCRHSSRGGGWRAHHSACLTSPQEQRPGMASGGLQHPH